MVLCSLARSQFIIDESNDRFRPTERLRPCHLPRGEGSFCVGIDRCPLITTLIEYLRKPLPGDVALIIRDSYFCPKFNPDDPQEPQTVCCPFRGIEPPPKRLPTFRNKENCSFQNGVPAVCTLYDTCSPILQLLTNLRQPFPSDVPNLMQASILCGAEVLGGFSVPKVCCPEAAVIAKGSSTTTSAPSSSETSSDATR